MVVFALQTRALLCLTTLTNALLESLVKVQEALRDCQRLTGNSTAVQSSPTGPENAGWQDQTSPLPDTQGASSGASWPHTQHEPGVTFA